MVGACDFKEVTISCKLVIRWWSQEPWCISARDSQRQCLCGAKPEPAAHCAGTGHGADVSTAAGCSNWAARPMSLWSNGTFFSTSTCLAWCYLRVVGLPCKMEGFLRFPLQMSYWNSRFEWEPSPACTKVAESEGGEIHCRSHSEPATRRNGRAAAQSHTGWRRWFWVKTP